MNNKFSILCVEDENETENATDVMNNQTIASPRQDIGHRNCQVTQSIAAGDVQSTSSANWSQRQTQRLLLPIVSGRDATCPKDNHDQQSKRPSHHSKIAIVGDSMLKYLNSTKLRQNLRKNVLVRTFPGAKVKDMKHYVQPTLSTPPETLVLHVGTNDLSQKSVQEVLQDLTSLGQSICTDSPTTKLVISGIIKRTDNSNLTSKVSELNATLRQVCTTNNWGYISHESIDRTHLNTSGVHLNKKGTAIMAQNIKHFFKYSN